MAATTRAARPLRALARTWLRSVLVVAGISASVSCGYSTQITHADSREPNDPEYSQQWSLPAVAMPQAWSGVTGSRDVKVAVVDSGVEVLPDLAANLGEGVTCTPTCVPGAGADVTGHGTAVASILGSVGNNGIDLAGVAWEVTMLPVRVEGRGGVTSIDGIANGIRWAVSNGARVVNLSLITRGEQPAIAAAIAASPEVLFVVPAGNDSRDIDEQQLAVYPCADPAPNVVCVTATGRDAALMPTSNTGAISVDLAAPGADMIAAGRNGNPVFKTGTSFAAPMVSGAAAIMLAAHPTATAADVKAALVSGATRSSATDNLVAAGFLNVAASLNALDQ